MLKMKTVDIHGTALPDPLFFQNGEPVQTPADWGKRRAELLELFRVHIYGRAPIEAPDDLSFVVAETQSDALNGAATRKQIAIRFGGFSFDLKLLIPNAAPRKSPCFVLANNRMALSAGAHERDFWPADYLIARGYAAAVFDMAQLDPDFDDGFRNGIHALYDKGKRATDAWGTIASWAWGASRAMDYLQIDAEIDATKIALVGHSRGGKAALWAGAQDERFALTVSNDSGCSGAALAREAGGETIAQINEKFPHWFCENYKIYNDREDDLPIDQHQLLALMAPRLLYVASASQDEWANPYAEFQAAVAASPVYRVLDKIGLPSLIQPARNVAMLNGHIGHHCRTGKHDLTRFDWARFLDFADSQGWNAPDFPAELAAEPMTTEIPDPTYGYDRNALLQVGAPAAPADFTEFWRETFAQTMNAPLAISRREIESADAQTRVFEIEFDSWENFRVAGWLTVPRDGNFARGVVVGHGYGGREAPTYGLPGPPAVALFPCARGFHRSRRVAMPDSAARHVLHGIETRETYIIRACVADLWASASVLLELFPHIADNLDYSGGSFGGGLGALMLPFDARFRRAHLDVPTFGNHPLRVQLPCNGSGRAISSYCARHPAALQTLAYFDAATAARLIAIPALVSPALSDPAVPPPGQFAVYNALGGAKKLWIRRCGHPTDQADDATLFAEVAHWFDA